MAVYFASKNDRITFHPEGGEPHELACTSNTSLTVRGGVRIAVVQDIISTADPEPLRRLDVGDVGRLRIEKTEGDSPIDIACGAIVAVVRDSERKSAIKRVMVIVEAVSGEAC